MGENGSKSWYINLLHAEVSLMAMESGKETVLTKGTYPAIQKLLREFRTVFHMPSGLPPKRSREHAITLQEGTSPINIRPYRDSHIQKNEIEKLVREMLQAGINNLASAPSQV